MFALMRRRAWWLAMQLCDVSPSEAALSADLGGSSSYSNGIFED